MKINAATQRPLTLLLLLAFLHGLLAPMSGVAAGHGAVRTLLMPMCGEGAAFIEVEIGDNTDSSTDVFGHTGFCLLCCCPSAPAEINIGDTWLFAPARIKPSAFIDSRLTCALPWLPTLPRAPPAFS